MDGCKYWEYHEDTKGCILFDSDVLDCDLDVGPPAPSYDQCFPGNQKLYLLDIVYIGE